MGLKHLPKDKHTLKCFTEFVKLNADQTIETEGGFEMTKNADHLEF